MQLRKAQQEDTSVLYALWEEAFGDTKETIDLFFDTCFQIQNTLVAVCDGQVRSVVYLLRNTLQNGGKSFTASYIYAAATEKAYRGKGLMRALLEYTTETENARGTDFLYLVPANAHLFRYYEKCGFHIAFGKQICTFSREELLEYANTETVTVPYVLWNADVLRFAERLACRFGEQYLRCENGFAVWEEAGEVAEITELCTASADVRNLLCELLHSCAAHRFALPLPCGTVHDDTALQTENTAMLKALSERAQAQTIKNAYIGLTLG